MRPARLDPTLVDLPLKVRLTQPILSYLDGSQLFQVPDDLERHGYGSAGAELVAKVQAARVRKDGSKTVTLTQPGELYALDAYVDTLLDCASDNAGPDDPSATGELIASRSLLRKLRQD